MSGIKLTLNEIDNDFEKSKRVFKDVSGLKIPWKGDRYKAKIIEYSGSDGFFHCNVLIINYQYKDFYFIDNFKDSKEVIEFLQLETNVSDKGQFGDYEIPSLERMQGILELRENRLKYPNLKIRSAKGLDRFSFLPSEIDDLIMDSEARTMKYSETCKYIAKNSTLDQYIRETNEYEHPGVIELWAHGQFLWYAKAKPSAKALRDLYPFIRRDTIKTLINNKDIVLSYLEYVIKQYPNGDTVTRNNIFLKEWNKDRKINLDLKTLEMLFEEIDN